MLLLCAYTNSVLFFSSKDLVPVCKLVLQFHWLNIWPINGKTCNPVLQPGISTLACISHAKCKWNSWERFTCITFSLYFVLCTHNVFQWFPQKRNKSASLEIIIYIYEHNVIINWFPYNAFKQRGLVYVPRTSTLSVAYTYTCTILIHVGNIKFDHHIALTWQIYKH